MIARGAFAAVRMVSSSLPLFFPFAPLFLLYRFVFSLLTQSRSISRGRKIGDKISVLCESICNTSLCHRRSLPLLPPRPQSGDSARPAHASGGRGGKTGREIRVGEGSSPPSRLRQVHPAYHEGRLAFPLNASANAWPFFAFPVLLSSPRPCHLHKKQNQTLLQSDDEC